MSRDALGTLAVIVGARLKDAGEILVAAESCTGDRKSTRLNSSH